MSKQYTQNGVHIIECAPSEFSIVLKNQYKKNLTEDTYVNANFFAKFDEDGEYFTLPVGHLVCDFDATGKYLNYYCNERGKFDNNKFCFDSGNWNYNNPFYGKAVSTFVIKNGKPQIIDLAHVDFTYDYAVAGVPVIRNGQDVKFKTYVTGQGWGGSSLYAAKHILLGLKPNSDIIYIMGWQSTTSNLIYSAEAYKKFSAMGFSELIKLDGGGSYIMKYKGKVIDSTTENRRDNAFIIIKDNKKENTVLDSNTINNPYPKPTRILTKNMKGTDIKWVQTQLKKAGYDIAIDGSFGPTTQKLYQDFALKSLEEFK